MHKFSNFSANNIVLSEKNVIFALKIDEIVTFASHLWQTNRLNFKLVIRQIIRYVIREN